MCKEIVTLCQFGTPLADGLMLGLPNLCNEHNNECFRIWGGCIVVVVVY
jgi:hypothetical protein